MQNDIGMRRETMALSAATAQRAPEQKRQDAQQASRPVQAGGQKQNAQKDEGMKGRLARLPFGAGLAALVLLCVLALPVGNFRALQGATPQAFLRQGDVASIVEDRIDAAENVKTVASRASVDDALLRDVDDAVAALKSAKTARDVSRADQSLTMAVAELIDRADSALTGENGAMLSREADNFAEQGSFLRQEARAYNQQAEKAEKLYESLPTKFLLRQPDLYEGI